MSNRTQPRLAALLAAVSLLACASFPDDETDAGPPPAADSGTDAGDSGTEPVGETIRFNPTVRIIDESGTVTVLQEGAWIGEEAPAALVPGGLSDGGLRVYPAQHVGADGYVVEGVPEGYYLLRFNNTHLWTDARQVELRSTQVQRSDLDWTVPAGTALDLRITGLAPWQPSDSLQRPRPRRCASRRARPATGAPCSCSAMTPWRG